MADALVVSTDSGLYCPAGDFHIDPWRPVPRALITHAHGDHLRAGSAAYWYAACGEGLVRTRLPGDFAGTAVAYGEPLDFGRARVSFHPAGHILGSAQIRIEADGAVWIVSGDYKRDPDPTCEPFEVLPCDVFISEATFALPVYRWEPTASVIAEIRRWWQANRERGQATVLYCYALGKAQRLLAELAPFVTEPVFLHGAMQGLTDAYRDAGVALAPTAPALAASRGDFAGSLVLAPPSAGGSTWTRRLGDHAAGFCSGWMRIRGNRRRRGYDRGFVLSDHADWPSLLRTFAEVDPRRVLLTHGQTDTLTRYLNESGRPAASLRTDYGAED